MTIKAGILSDTHLSVVDNDYKALVARCFGDCDVIIHAGDLTNIKVLEAFSDKEVHGVHGNMCDASSYRTLPREKTFKLLHYTIGLTHGAHLGHDIELNLWNLFSNVDCMIYGHTHRPVCHYQGGILIINPGCFKSTGKYGSPGTYAILEAGEYLEGSIHEVPRLT
jgi:hypothetical protein